MIDASFEIMKLYKGGNVYWILCQGQNGIPNMAVNRKHDDISMILLKKLALFLWVIPSNSIAKSL